MSIPMILGPCDLVFKVSFIVLRMNDTDSIADNGKIQALGRWQDPEKLARLDS
jgi:hypothetical protein